MNLQIYHLSYAPSQSQFGLPPLSNVAPGLVDSISKTEIYPSIFLGISLEVIFSDFTWKHECLLSLQHIVLYKVFTTSVMFLNVFHHQGSVLLNYFLSFLSLQPLAWEEIQHKV